MPPIRFSPLPRLNLSLKPLFLFSTSSLSPKNFTIPKRTLLASSRTLSTLASAQPASDNGASDGKYGALSPPQKEELQKIDVNSPKGTRDFPPEDMRLRNWLFTHFREVLQEVLRCYSVPENQFGKVCIIIDKGFDGQGKLRAICDGGRYDRLLSTFGGDDIPACGFGFGDAVIVELLKEKELLPELNLEFDNIVCALDSSLQGIASRVITILRGKGQSADLVLENKPLKWVFKRAA